MDLPSYIKVPVEMAQFAVKRRKTRPLQSYLAALFHFPGKARVTADPIFEIANVCGVHKRTVQRSFDWLLQRGWIGKDKTDGWFFYRGLDRIHLMEDWKFHRAAIMQRKDLRTYRGFFIGAVLCSLVKSGVGTGTDRPRRRSGPPRFPISISAVEEVFGVSRSTAKRYRKIAENCGYIKMEPNLVQVNNLTPVDVQQLVANNIEIINVDLFGVPGSVNATPDQLRTYRGKVLLQRPNFVYPIINLKKR